MSKVTVLCAVGRSERYRHDTHDDNADSDDDGEDSMFHSFSSCSPRYSQDHIRFDRVRHSIVTYTLHYCCFILV